MSIKKGKPTIKPMSLEKQIHNLELAINNAVLNNTSCRIGVLTAKSILVTLKRLPKGVD